MAFAEVRMALFITPLLVAYQWCLAEEEASLDQSGQALASSVCRRNHVTIICCHCTLSVRTLLCVWEATRIVAPKQRAELNVLFMAGQQVLESK